MNISFKKSNFILKFRCIFLVVYIPHWILIQLDEIRQSGNQTEIRVGNLIAENIVQAFSYNYYEFSHQ